MLCFSLSGQVRNLKISKICDNALFTTAQSNFLGVSGVAAAAFGEGLSSTVLSGSSAGAEIDIDFFSCTVDGEEISGKFYNVDFKEGDCIDFAVYIDFGQRTVCAAKDPLRRFVWTLPYRTKGHIAQRESNFLGSFYTSFIFAILSFLAVFLADHEPGFSPVEMARIGALIGFILMMIVSYRVCRKVFRTSTEATEAFRVLGFAHPANLNFPKGHRKAERQYAADTGGKEAEEKPWRFRYNESDLLKVSS